jgi:hypothetical protein
MNFYPGTELTRQSDLTEDSRRRNRDLDELFMSDPKPFRSSVEQEWERSCHRLPANLHGKLQCSSLERASERLLLTGQPHKVSVITHQTPG